MNKKIIWTSLLVWTLLLTSCGTKPLGTFDEEMNRKQERLVSYIEQSFKDYEEMSFGKFTQDAKFSVEADFQNDMKLKYAFGMAADSISDDKNAFKWNVDLEFSWEVSKNPKNEEMKKVAWNSILAKWKLNIWLLENNLYLGLDSADFKVKNETKEPSWASFEAFDIKPFADQLAKKWVKIELNKFFPKEAIDALNSNVETRKQMLEFKNTLVSSIKDVKIFTPWGKTTVDGKEAYKITVDEAKFKESMKKFAVNFIKKSKELSPEFASLDDSMVESQIDEVFKDFKIFEQDAYIVRSGKDDIDIVFKKIVYGNEFSKVESSFALLSDGIKFSVKPLWEQYKEGENLLVFNLTKKEWEISFKDAWFEPFKITYKNGKWEFVFVDNYSDNKVTWNFSLSGKWVEWKFKVIENEKEIGDVDFKLWFKFSKTKANLTLDFKVTGERFKKEKLDYINLKFVFDSNIKKNPNLVIDEKYIIWNEKTLTPEEFWAKITELFPQASMFPMMMGWANFSEDITFDEGELDSFEISSWEIEALTWVTE